MNTSRVVWMSRFKFKISLLQWSITNQSVVEPSNRSKLYDVAITWVKKLQQCRSVLTRAPLSYDHLNNQVSEQILFLITSLKSEEELIRGLMGWIKSQQWVMSAWRDLNINSLCYKIINKATWHLDYYWATMVEIVNHSFLVNCREVEKQYF